MKRYIKHLLLAYVVVVSIALVAALPGVLGAPEVMPGGEAAAVSLNAGQDGPGGSLSSSNSQDTPPTPSAGENAALELTPDGWEIIAPGIEYQEFHFKKSNPYGLPAPNNAYVARMVREQQEVILESSIAQGRLASGRESVTGMADRYNQTINYWGGQWGNRNRVVVAINGYYFDPLTGYPHRGQIHSSWYSKRFDDVQNGSGFVWNTDRSVFMGECMKHPADKQFITILKSGKTQLFNGVNVPRGSNELIIYTPQYDANTNTDDDPKSVEAVVELSKPAALLKASEMITGTVRSIHNNVGSAVIPFDHIVLSARGTARDELLTTNDLNEGDEVGITQKISNCNSSLPIEWINTYASIGGHFYFLKEGNVQSYPDNSGATSRHPRTAIAYNDQYIFYIVVDGRNPAASIGMTTNELAVFSRDVLQATHGVSEDGGGSSTMVINGQVQNNTFCNDVFCKATVYLPLTVASGGNKSSAAPGDREQTPLYIPGPSFDPEDEDGGEDSSGLAGVDLSDGTYQRLVANGMLMVVVEPMTKTTTFTPGENVQIWSTANVRLGPGLNYGILATLSPGIPGTVVDHANGLNGVFATGYNWWKVDFGGGLVGWVGEVLITPPSQSSQSTKSYLSFFR